MSVARRIARDERGLTLVELLAALAVGAIVLFGVLVFTVTGIEGSLRAQDRSDSAQRGRLALDRMVTVLQSQVCLDVARPPIVSGTDSAVTFYADTHSETFRPRRHSFTYDPSTGRIAEAIDHGSGSPPAITFGGAPDELRAVASGVRLISGRPLLRYYAFTSSEPTTATVLLPTPLSPADARRVVRVNVAFKVIADRTGKPDRRATTIEGDAYVGSLEATHDPSAGPRCS